jgi:uncharacterized protein YjbJ (UPF0337 family)
LEKEYFKGQWNQLKGSVKESWGKITDDELLRTEVDYDKVVGLVQERYGLAVTDAKEKINGLIKSLKTKMEGSNEKIK